MNSYIIDSLTGSGIIFPIFFLDILATLLAIFATKNFLLPGWKHFAFTKKLDEICDSDSRHWFYGHMKKYGIDDKGLKNSIKRTEKFPYVFNSWFGPVFSEVICHHPATTKAILSSGAPKDENIYRFIRDWIGDGLLTSSGKKWQRNRKLLTPAFHYNILKPYVGIFNESVKIMLKKWELQINEPLDVTESVTLLTLDSILHCAMSYESDCQNMEGKHPYVSAVRDLSLILMERFEKPYLLSDTIFYYTALGKKFRKAIKTVHDLAEKIIENRRKALQEKKLSNDCNPDPENRKRILDFVDILLETKDEDGNGLTDSEIRDEVDTFLFAGHDTTASGISWILYNLAQYPNFQKKCRDEIFSIVGKKENVEWDDLGKLNYLTMFIKESIRIYPPVPEIGRFLNEPLKISGNKPGKEITIPPESTVSPCIIAQHRNPLVWEDPEKFHPERFSVENITKRPSHAYIPFSAGPRNCIGQNFAMNEIKVVIAQCLRKYEFYLDDETPVPKMKFLLVLWSENGIFVKFKPI